MEVKITPDLQLHLPSLKCGPNKVVANLGLPNQLQKLLEVGPVAFCERSDCHNPIFQESCVDLLEKRVQRSLLGSGEVEMTSILASRYYCSPWCYIFSITTTSFMWERELLGRALPTLPCNK